MLPFEKQPAFLMTEAAEILGVTREAIQTWNSRNPTEFMGQKIRHRIHYSLIEIYFLALVRDLTAYGVGVRVAMHTAAQFAREISEPPIGPLRDEVLFARKEGDLTHMRRGTTNEAYSLESPEVIIPLRKIWDNISQHAREVYAREES